MAKGQKVAQNDKKVCLSHSLSQEPYIIWLWFLVHMFKMMISPANFSFFKILIFGFFKGIKGKKWPTITNFSLFFSISQERRSYRWDFDDDICRCFSLFFFKCNIVNIKIVCFLLALFNSFLIIICFSSSSINVKKKFWYVPHLLHMCVIVSIPYDCKIMTSVVFGVFCFTNCMI